MGAVTVDGYYFSLNSKFCHLTNDSLLTFTDAYLIIAINAGLTASAIH